MKVVKLKPYTNGTRHQINIKKNLLSKSNKFYKQSIFGFKRFVGRSSVNGRITIRHKGSGCKKKFRSIDFSNSSKNSLVLSIMHDPFRNAFVSLNFDLERKTFFRTIATQNVGPGSLQIRNNIVVDLKLGNCSTLKNVPTGSILHSLNLSNNSKFVRSAGTFFQIIQKNIQTCQVRLPSGFIKKVSTSSFGTIGIVSNSQHNLIYIGKAGRCRLMGIRPSVRGIAMNPVDHPHGGKSNKGCLPMTPWGILTKGKPTVKKSKKH
jgi:large subunit ribosomal protein L2